MFSYVLCCWWIKGVHSDGIAYDTQPRIVLEVTYETLSPLLSLQLYEKNEWLVNGLDETKKATVSYMVSHGQIPFSLISAAAFAHDSESAVTLKTAAIKTMNTEPVQDVWMFLWLYLLTLLFSLLSPAQAPFSSTFVEIQGMGKLLRS